MERIIGELGAKSQPIRVKGISTISHGLMPTSFITIDRLTLSEWPYCHLQGLSVDVICQLLGVISELYELCQNLYVLGQ